MVYTVTLNPAVDYVMRFADITEGEVNRACKTELFVGGKGINVSCVLAEFNISTKALGFTAGFTGDFIEQQLQKQAIANEFIRLKNGISRINVKLKSDIETDLNAQGPIPEDDDVDRLTEKLDRLTAEDFLVISGNIPKEISDEQFEKIFKTAIHKGAKLVIDTTGKRLLSSLKYCPFLIKPNKAELCELFSVGIITDKQIEHYALKLKELGARNVLVSLAEKGAVLVDETARIHRISALKGKTVNSVGAGDSMIAGFIAGVLQTGDYQEALRLANVCGAATAFSQGLATKAEIDRLLRL